MWAKTAVIHNVIARDTHVTPSDSKWLTSEKIVRFIRKKHKRGRCGLRNNKQLVSISIRCT